MYNLHLCNVVTLTVARLVKQLLLRYQYGVCRRCEVFIDPHFPTVLNLK